MEKELTSNFFKKWHLLVSFSGISLLLVVGAFLYYSSEKHAIRESKQQEIKAIADLKINQLTQWHKERIADIIILSHSDFFLKEVREWVKNRKIFMPEKEFRNQLQAIKTNYGYHNIILASTKGDCLFSLNEDENSLNTLTSEAIAKAVTNGKITYTDLYYSADQSTICYDIITTIEDGNHHAVAGLVFRVDPNDFLYPLIQSWPTPSTTSETLLVRKDGDSVLSLNNLRKAKNTALHFRRALTQVETPAVKAVLGYKGIFEGKDYRGVEVLAYIEPVSGTPWFMVAKVDKSEIYAELRYRAVVIGIFTLVLILLAVSSLVLIYKSRQKNIYVQLLASEKNLVAKHQEFKTTLYSIGDGVITTDIKGNVSQLNPVAEQLTGWAESEAIGKPLEEIFRIINEDSRNTVENPVEKVLREGMIVGLANHTLLISKNAEETPIADSGAPIKNEAGEITGVVLVFRDQTQERQANRALQQSEATIRNKLKAITQPEGDIGTLELSDIIDVEVMQPILEDFFRLTGMLGAILDISGKVLVAVGWQDICTKFHRCHPETLKNCIESDTILADGVPEGQYRTYHCKNNMWDMVTPLIIGEKHMGNIFIGQFLYADEKPDVDLFRLQAQRYGFDEEEYIAALNRVPHFKKEDIDSVMQFYARLTGMISRLSYSSVQQSRLLAQRNLAEKSLRVSEAKFRNFFEHSPMGKSITAIDGSVNVNKSFCDLLGYQEVELKSAKWQQISHPDDIEKTDGIMQSLRKGEIISACFEKRYLHKNGSIVWADVSSYLQHDENGDPMYFITTINDITRRKKAEEEAQASAKATQHLLEVADKSREVMLSVIEDEKNARQQLKALNEELEQKIAERTKDLSDRNSELKRMNKLFVDRELRMVELKKKIKELEGNKAPN